MRAICITTALLFVPAVASAHIHLTAPKSRTDSLTGDQKEQHCGVANQVRNPGRVTTFAPGQTITVTWLETINHPGWYRIALQPDGANFPIPAGTAGPCVTGGGVTSACPVGNANCNFPVANQQGTDGPTGSIIIADRIPDGTLSMDITLPNIECANCTLQFIQVMTDKCPYTTDALSDDIYFNCADITISSSAPPVDAGVSDAPTNPGGPDGGGGGGGETSGGCSTSGSGTAFAALLALAGLAITRRRRR